MSEMTPPLPEWLGASKQVLREALRGGEIRFLGYQKVSYKANWKTISDNDSFHGPLLHKAFSLLNWQGGLGSQQIDAERGHVAYCGEVKPVSESQQLIKDYSLLSYDESDPFDGDSRMVVLYPVVAVVKHLDVINIRFTIPRSVDDTEVHFAYYSHLDDDCDLIRQRVRQSSNLLGPCGIVSMEDASVFHRLHIGCSTPGNAVFQKGVKSFDQLDLDLTQNDEAGNLVRWEHYRKTMGFERLGV